MVELAQFQLSLARRRCNDHLVFTSICDAMSTVCEPWAEVMTRIKLSSTCYAGCVQDASSDVLL